MNEELMEHRLKAVESDMHDVKNTLEEMKLAIADMKSKGVDPKIYAAVFGLIGIVVSTFGSIITTVIMAMFTK